MIHLYTGEGKGKTTTAVGLAIRNAGWGNKVVFAQFMKGNESGELYSFQRFENIQVIRNQKNYGFYKNMSDADKQEITENHNAMLNQIIDQVKLNACNLIVLDEITYPVKWKLLDEELLKQLISFVKSDAEVELVFTGRDANSLLADNADYITNMECVRHPFDSGIKAREGIEF